MRTNQQYTNTTINQRLRALLMTLIMLVTQFSGLGSFAVAEGVTPTDLAPEQAQVLTLPAYEDVMEAAAQADPVQPAAELPAARGAADVQPDAAQGQAPEADVETGSVEEEDAPVIPAIPVDKEMKVGDSCEAAIKTDGGIFTVRLLPAKAQTVVLKTTGMDIFVRIRKGETGRSQTYTAENGELLVQFNVKAEPYYLTFAAAKPGSKGNFTVSVKAYTEETVEAPVDGTPAEKAPAAVEETVTTYAPVKEPAVVEEAATTYAPVEEPAVVEETVTTYAPVEVKEVATTYAPAEEPAVVEEVATTYAPVEEPDVVEETVTTYAPVDEAPVVEEIATTYAPVEENTGDNAADNKEETPAETTYIPVVDVEVVPVTEPAAETTYTEVEDTTYTVADETTYTEVEETTYTEVEDTTYTVVEETTYTVVEDTTYTVVDETTYTPAEETPVYVFGAEKAVRLSAIVAALNADAVMENVFDVDVKKAGGLVAAEALTEEADWLITALADFDEPVAIKVKQRKGANLELLLRNPAQSAEPVEAPAVYTFAFNGIGDYTLVPLVVSTCGISFTYLDDARVSDETLVSLDDDLYLTALDWFDAVTLTVVTDAGETYEITLTNPRPQVTLAAGDFEAAPVSAEAAQTYVEFYEIPVAQESLLRQAGYAAFDISLTRKTRGAKSGASDAVYTVPVTLDAALNPLAEVSGFAVIDKVTYELYHVTAAGARKVENVVFDEDPDTHVLYGFTFVAEEGFSPYVVTYTVDFHYVDEQGVEYDWSWDGASTYAIADILAALGADPEAEVTQVTLALTEAVGETAEDALYLSEDKATLISDVAFDDTYTLTMTTEKWDEATGTQVIRNYVVTVTDAQSADVTITFYGADGETIDTNAVVDGYNYLVYGYDYSPEAVTYFSMSNGVLTAHFNHQINFNEYESGKRFILIRYTGSDVPTPAVISQGWWNAGVVSDKRKVDTGVDLGIYTITDFEHHGGGIYNYTAQKQDAYFVNLGFLDQQQANPVTPGVTEGAKAINQYAYVRVLLSNAEGKFVGYGLSSIPTTGSINSIAINQFTMFNQPVADVTQGVAGGNTMTYAQAKTAGYSVATGGSNVRIGYKDQNQTPAWTDFDTQANGFSTGDPDGYTFARQDRVSPDERTVYVRIADPTYYYVQLDAGDEPLTIPDDVDLYVLVHATTSTSDLYAYEKITNADSTDGGKTFRVQVSDDDWFQKLNSGGYLNGFNQISGHENNVTVSLSAVPADTTVNDPSPLLGMYEKIAIGGTVQTHEVESYPSIDNGDTSDPEQRVQQKGEGVVEITDIIHLVKNEDRFNLYTLEKLLNGGYNVVTLCPGTNGSMPRGVAADAQPGPGDAFIGCHQMGSILVRGDVAFASKVTGISDSPQAQSPVVVGGYFGNTSQSGCFIPGRTGDRDKDAGGVCANFYVGSINSIVEGGRTYVNGKPYQQEIGAKPKGIAYNGHTYVNDSYVDWNRLQSVMRNSSRALYDNAETDIYAVDGETVNVDLGSNVVIHCAADARITVNIEGQGAEAADAPGTVINFANTGNAIIPKLEVNGATQNTVETGEGISVVWNYPYATGTVDGPNTSEFGHVLAPRALVRITAGNYSGTMVGNNVYLSGDAEGHLYPYRGGQLVGFQAEMDATKLVDGGEPLPFEQYEFELMQLRSLVDTYEYDELVAQYGTDQDKIFWEHLQTVENNGSSIKFEDVNFYSRGTYIFMLQENADSVDEGMTADPKRYIVECQVGNTVNGTTNTLSMDSIKYYEVTGDTLFSIEEMKDEEDNVWGYRTHINESALTQKGTINWQTGKIATDIEFLNTEKKAGITITKRVNGANDRSATFIFNLFVWHEEEVTLEGAEPYIEYTALEREIEVSGTPGTAKFAKTQYFDEQLDPAAYHEAGHIAFELTSGSSFTASGLPAGWRYAVVEDEARMPEGYLLASVSDNAYGTVSDNEEENVEISFTNTYVGRYCVAVTKVWDDDNDRDGVRPDSIFVNLYQSTNVDGTVTYYDAAGSAYTEADKVPYRADIELNDANNWVYMVRGVPTGDINGNLYTYTWEEYILGEDGTKTVLTLDAAMTEENEVEGYWLTKIEKSQKEVVVPGTDEQAVITTLTNTHVSERVKVKAVKKWDEAASTYGLAKDVDVTLFGSYTDGGTTYFITDSDITHPVQTIKAGGDPVVWDNLPAYVKGKKITYTVTEAVPEGSVQVSSTYEADGTTYTVTFNNAVETGYLVIDKAVLVDNAPITSDPGVTYYVTVTRTIGEDVWYAAEDGSLSETLTVIPLTWNYHKQINNLLCGEYTVTETTETGYAIGGDTQMSIGEAQFIPAASKTSDTAFVNKDGATAELRNTYVNSRYCITVTKQWLINGQVAVDDDELKLWVELQRTTTPKDESSWQQVKGIRMGDTIQVDVDAADEGYDYIELNKTNNWTAVALGQPQFAENGDRYSYRWVEGVLKGDTFTAGAPVGWQAATTVSSYETVQSSEKDGTTLVFLTKLTNEKILTEVPVTKVWEDKDNQDGIRPGSIEVVLLADGEAYATAVLAEANDWSHTFYELPKVKADEETGKAVDIKYTVEEPTVTGYTVAIKAEGSGYVITNTHEPATTYTAVTKVWDDKEDEAGMRPDVITMYLLVNNEKTGSTYGLTERNGWTETVYDLPLYKEGKLQTYSWLEDTVGLPTGYSISDIAIEAGKQRGVDGYEYTITNTYDTERFCLEILKVWDDADDQDGLRPKTLTVTLSASGYEIKDVQTSYELNAGNNWTALAKGLPKLYQGEPIVYLWTEDFANNDEYSLSGYEAWTVEADLTTKITVLTNVHAPETTYIPVVKVWDDAEDQDGLRPDKVTVVLMNGEKAVAKLDLEKDNYAGTFFDLPVYEGGEKIKYTLIEPNAVAGYPEVKIVGSGETGFTVTNKHVPETTFAEIVKVWDDAEDQDGLRPKALTVYLTVDGVQGSGYVLNEDNKWKAKTGELPKYAKGKEIKYGWAEGGMPEGYNLTGTSVSGYVTTLTNSYVPKTTYVPVEKRWDDKDNQDGKRPGSIEVTLKADGTAVDSAVLAEANKWQYTFENLPKYAEGEEIVYTVDEVPVDGYKSTTGYVGSVYVITNYYVPETTYAEVEKIWDDNKDAEGVRPTTITVYLLANNEAMSTYQLTADASYYLRVDDLPVYVKGVYQSYSWTEETKDLPAGYSMSGLTTEKQKDGGVKTTITNSFNTEETSAVVLKVWDDGNDQDGKRPKALTVYLLADGEVLSSYVLTEANGWAASAEGLAIYADGKEIEYTWSEYDLPEGYELKTPAKNGQITTLTNVHAPETTDIPVKKIWEDNENQDGKRPEKVTVVLMNGEKAVAKLDLAKDEYAGVFEDLPVYEKGAKIKYTVEEPNMIEGYVLVGIAETTYEGVTGYEITNKHEPETTYAEIVKVWDDAEDQDGVRPESLQVKLLANGDEISVYTLAAEDWSAKAENLPKYAKGEEIEYTWSEYEVPTGYELSDTGVSGKVTTITNTYVPATTHVPVEKRWDDKDNQDGKRPGSIEVTLKADGTAVDSAVLAEANKWQHTFENLPKNKTENGKTEKIVYTVDEVAVEGYEAITGYVGSVYVITNYYVPETTYAEVEKIWDDNKDAEGVRPTTITVYLLANNEAMSTYQLTADASYYLRVDDLPVYVKGVYQSYSWTEETKDLPAGYSMSGLTTEKQKDGGVKTTITNSFNTEETSAVVLKVWDDGNDQDGKRPKALTVYLLADGEVLSSYVLTEANGWAASAEGLAIYADGKEIEYTWSEYDLPEGYELKTPAKNGQITTLTNVHPLETTYIPVEKVWDDFNNIDGKRPESITVVLYNGEGETAKPVAQKELTEADKDLGDAWSYKFVDLPKFERVDGESVEINYTVREFMPVALNTTYTEAEGSPAKNEDGVWVLTNKYAPKTEITVTKVWDDADDLEGFRPEIQVQLYEGSGSDATKVGEPVSLYEADGWTYTWTDLDKYAWTTDDHTEAEELHYAVREVVDGEEYKGSSKITLDENGDIYYLVTITDNGDGTITVTNTHTPETTYVPVAKIWDDENDAAGFRPERITILLLANGKPVDKTVLDDSNEWHDTFYNLPKYAEGEKIAYDVDEVAVEGYTMEKTGDAENGFTLTNTHVPKTTYTVVKKVWNDNNDAAQVRPASIEVVLLVNNEESTTYTLTSAYDWTMSVYDLPLYKAGELQTYSWKENSIGSGYDMTDLAIEVAKGVTTVTITNSYDTDRFCLAIQKIWDDGNDQDGKRTPVQVTLKKLADGKLADVSVTDADGKAIPTGYELNEDNNWTVMVKGLPIKEQGGKIAYVWVEDESNTSYSLVGAQETDEGEKYVVATTESRVASLTNKHVPLTTFVPVEKVWEDNENQDGLRPERIVVYLLADEVPVEKAELNESNSWYHVFENLPVYAEGEKIAYDVDEVAVEGYTVEKAGNAESGYVLTNTHEPETTFAEIVKVWDDAENQDGVRPENLQVKLLANGDEVSVYTLAAADWSAKAENLPKYAKGVEIEYTWSEYAVPTGYELSDTGVSGKVTTITNTYVPATTHVPVEKRWDDKDNQDGKRPGSIEVTLKADGTAVDSAVLAEANKWQYTFENLPKYAEGEEIVYTVDEVPVDGYKSTTGYVGSVYVITNYYVPKTTYTVVKKVWNDNNDAAQVRPASIEVVLLVNNEESTTYTLTSAYDWTMSVYDLPLYKAGELQTYSWKENSIGSGYDMTDLAIEVAKGVTTVTITNSYDTDRFCLAIQKIWDDGNDQDGKRTPVQVTLKKLADGKLADVSVTDADGKAIPTGYELNEDNNWTVMVKGLPIKEQGGKIAYVWVEDESNTSYSLVGAQETDEGEKYVVATTESRVASLTNKHVPLTTFVPVEKVWEDNENQDGLRPERIVVYLLADEVPVEKAELNESNSWYHVFENLPVYAEGEKIAYDVDEVAVEGYTVEKAGNAESGYVLTNTHEPETTYAEVKKVWDDAENQDGLRPEALTVYLTVDGVQGSGYVLNEANNWHVKTGELPKYADGVEIKYGWAEGEMPEGYSLTGTSVSGYVTTLTNSYVPEITNVPVEKRWDDGENNDGKRPTSVTFVLSADGEAIDEVTLSDRNEWQYTFENLPKNKTENGKTAEIVYTVDEVAVEGYEAITGYVGSVYVITNYHVPETTYAVVEKIWADDGDAAGERPDSISVILMANNEKVVTTYELNEANNWSGYVGNLPVYEAGVYQSYSWIEDTKALPSGYSMSGLTTEKQKDGGVKTTITNSYDTERFCLTILKVWDDGDNRDNLRPEELQVTLLRKTASGYDYVLLTDADGVTAPAVYYLNEENHWTGMAMGVPILVNGEVAQYYWSEHPDYIGTAYTVEDAIYDEEIPGWIVKADQVTRITYLTNKYEPQTTYIPVEKVWEDEDDHDGFRPQSITVLLLADNKPIDRMDLNEGNNWRGTFYDLPVNAPKGQKIAYTVDEVTVDGYETAVTGSAESGYTITNTREVEYVDVEIRKEWSGDLDAEGKVLTALRPDSIDVTLYADGEALSVYTIIPDEKGDWSLTVAKLPKYRSGYEIAYELEEDIPASYVLGEDILCAITPSGYAFLVDNTLATGALKIYKAFTFDGKPVELTDAQKAALRFTVTADFGGETTYYVVKDGSGVNGNDGLLTTAENEFTYADFQDGYMVIDNLPVGDYTVTELGAEDLIPDYTLVSTTVDGKEAASGYATVELNAFTKVHFENNYEEDLGQLAVVKTFSGFDPADMDEAALGGLVFKVTGSGYEKQFTWADMTDGVMTLYDLPVGEYSVEERNQDGLIAGWTLTAWKIDGSPAKVVKNETARVEITNTYDKDLGKLIVEKTFSGTEDVDEAVLGQLTFEVTGPEDFTTTFTYADFDGTGYVLADLVPGKYFVTETNAAGLIANYTLEVTESTTAGAGQVTRNGVATVALTNTYTKDVGKLTITKAFCGVGPDAQWDEEKLAELSFTVTGSGFTSTYKFADFDVTELDGNLTRGVLTIENLPVGDYTVTESNAEGIVLGYTLHASSVTEDTVTVVKDATATAVIKNNYHKDSGKLILEKNFSENVKDLPETRTLEFHVVGSELATGSGYDETFFYAQFTDGRLEITGLTPGKYTVEEINAKGLVANYTLVTEGEDASVTTGSGYVLKDEEIVITLENNYTPDLGSLTIVKNFEGTPADADLNKLTFRITDGEGNIVKTVTYGEFTGTSYTLDNLAPGTYTITETNADTLIAAYTLTADTETEKTAEVTEGVTVTAEFTNTYEPALGKLIVKKTFSGTDEVDEDVLKALTFQVTGPEGFETTFTYADFTASGYVIDELPLGCYHVTETNADSLIADYTLVAAESTTDGSGLLEKHGDTATVALTNTYKQDKGGIQVTKLVIGAPEGNETKEYKIAVISEDGGKTTYYTPEGVGQEDAYWVLLTDGETATWSGLTVGDYRVIEDETDAQIDTVTLTVSGTGDVKVTVDATASVTVVNNYTEDLGSLKLVKTFSGTPDDADLSGLRFLVTGPHDYSRTVVYAEFTGDSFTIENLPVGVYTVTETNAGELIARYTLITEGEEASVTEGSGYVTKDDTAEVALTNNYEPDLGSLKIEKIFEGTGTATEAELNALTFQIKGPDGFATTYTYADFTSGYLVLKDLPIGTYAVKETNAEGLILHTVLLKAKSTTEGEAEVTKNAEATVELRNVYEPHLGKLEIIKRFSGNPADADLSSLYFTVTGPYDYATGFAYADFTDGKYTLENLPEGAYTVKETNADTLITGYTLLSVSVTEGEAKVVADSTVTVKLLNMYEQDLGSLKLIKNFSGTPAGADLTGLNFKVTGPDGYVLNVSYAAFTGGSYVIEKLVPGTYTVTETNAGKLVAGYTLLTEGEKKSTTSGEAEVVAFETAEVTLENNYEPDLGDLLIRKIWNGINTSEGSIDQESIKHLNFRVIGPNDFDKTVSYGEFENGVYTFYDLPAGVYAVYELNAGFLAANLILESSSKTGDYGKVVKNGLAEVTLTNNYDNALTSVGVKKIWDDGNDQDGLRPEGLTVYLLADGEEIKTVVLDESNNWSWTEEDLPMYNGDDKITYMWTEAEIPEYHQVGMELVGNVTIFINAHEPAETKATVIKIWDDLNDAQKVRPVFIYATLSDGTNKTVVILNKANNWTATVEHLPVYRNGEMLTYTWTEQEVLGYRLISTVTTGDTVTGITTTFTNYLRRRVPTTEIPDEPTPLSGFILINHVGDCFD